jgi:hypothetical protein
LWCGGGHLQKDCRKKGKHLRLRHATTVSWRKGKSHIPPTTAAVTRKGGDAEEEAAGNTQTHGL